MNLTTTQGCHGDLDFNSHTHHIPTEKPVGIPTESPYPQNPEIPQDPWGVITAPIGPIPIPYPYLWESPWESPYPRQPCLDLHSDMTVISSHVTHYNWHCQWLMFFAKYAPERLWVAQTTVKGVHPFQSFKVIMQVFCIVSDIQPDTDRTEITSF